MQDIERSYDAGHHLYFIRAKGTSLVKIGMSKSPLGRLERLQTGNPYELELLCVVPYAGLLFEKQLHHKFTKSGLHKTGEWFKFAAPIKRDIRLFKQITKEVGLKWSFKTNTVIMA